MSKKQTKYPDKTFKATDKNQPEKKKQIDLLFFAIGITIVFFILSFIGCLYHEPWRDEYQAYLIARASNSFSDLFYNMRYEGHPPFWHILLFLQTRIADSIFVTQLIHIFIASGTVFLISRYFKIPLWQKILIPFGYFFFYEFDLIARSYNSGIFFFVLSVIIYQKYFIEDYLIKTSDKNLKLLPFIFLGFILFLLENTSVIGVVMALCFWALLFSDCLKLWIDKRLKPEIWRVVFPVVLISAIGLFIAFSFMKAEPDNSYPIFYTKGFDALALKYSIGKILTNYFPLLPTNGVRFWNLNIFIDPTTGYETSWVAYAGLFLFIIFLMYFFIQSRVLLFWLCGTSGILAFVYLTSMRPLRYSGNMYIVFISSVALVSAYKNAPPLFNFSFSKKILTQAFNVLFIASLFANVYGGFVAYSKELMYPFSNCTNAGNFILKNNYTKMKIMGSSDFIISPLTYFTHQPVLLPESKKEQYFMIWNKDRNNNPLTFDYIIKMLVNQIDSVGTDSLLMVLGTELTYVLNNNTYGFNDDILFGTDVHLKAIQKFDSPCIVGDEKYYFYLATKVNKQG